MHCEELYSQTVRKSIKAIVTLITDQHRYVGLISPWQIARSTLHASVTHTL